MSETFVVKARGLPWSATGSEVVAFFSDVTILNGEEGVHFTFNKDGRPSGECFIEVDAKEDADRALAHDNEHMGKRYIEVKEAKHSEMEWVVNRMSSTEPVAGAGDGVVRLRGLPYGCSKQDIAQFFSGMQICPYGITLTMDQDGRASGDAYVEFATLDDAEKAMGKHKEKIGHRYIEVFRSSKSDIKYVVGGGNNGRPSLMNVRPGPYDRPQFGGARARGRGGMNLGPSGFSSGGFGSDYDSGFRGPRGGKGGPMRGGRSGGGMGGGMGGKSMGVQNSKTGHSIHMRGLPFEATMNDVISFFAPLNPVDIRLLYEQNRAKGECDVDFATHHDAEMAMQNDKQNMGHRYIELFLNSSIDGGSWSNNNNNTNTMPLGGGGRNGPIPLMNRGGSGGDGTTRGNYGSNYGTQDRNMGGNMGGNMGMGSMQGGNMGGNIQQGSNMGANMGGNMSSGMGMSSNTSGYGGGYNSFSENVTYPNVQSSNTGGNTGGSNFFGQSLGR